MIDVPNRSGWMAAFAVAAMLLAGDAQAQTGAASTPPPATADQGHRDKPLGPIQPFPGNGAGAYATRHYHDLFAEPATDSAYQGISLLLPRACGAQAGDR